MPQSHHDSLPELSSQLHDLIGEGWEQEVLSQLPADSEQHARRTGAFVRARGLTCAADLLRGLLAYVLCAPSFRQLGAWAVLIGLANLSHVAWQKQLRKARSFLLWLLMQCLAIPTQPVPVAMKRVVLIDATRLKEPGAVATIGACIWAMICWQAACSMSKSVTATPPRASRSLSCRPAIWWWLTAAIVAASN